ncbi:MAG: hypothetical protein AMJ89_05210 [candidate division Zixibacteria bacterium SM23_73]|nr:MAG: hypothetical protein AMJ89_05210 [candidate division Zixibacteria bacterium SM23_73]
MKRPVIFLMVLAVLICSAAEAQDSGFGLGIIIGEPTGLSAKLWTGYRTAVDGAVAWSFEKESSMHLHGDLLFHNFHLTKAHKGKFMTYYGIGGRVKFEDDGKLGVRVPLGINYLFAKTPLDVFLEIVPILDLAPNTDFSLNGAIGIRYFFGKRTYD